MVGLGTPPGVPQKPPCSPVVLRQVPSGGPTGTAFPGRGPWPPAPPPGRPEREATCKGRRERKGPALTGPSGEASTRSWPRKQAAGQRVPELPLESRIDNRPQVGREDPLDLSISLSGGKETNKDSPSSGERSGKSPSPNPRAPPRARGNCGVRKSGPAAVPAPRSF